MTARKDKALEAFLLAVTAAAFAALLSRSTSVEEYIYEYLSFCALNIVPSLFLFLIVSDMLCSFPSFMKLCGRLPFFGTEAALLVLGVLGGFPLGARVCASLYESGRIDKREAEYLLTFSNNAGVSFIYGFAGAGIFKSAEVGKSLLLIQIASAVFCAALFKLLLFGKGERGRIRGFGNGRGRKSLTAAVTDGTYTMISICAFIVVFGTSGALLSELFPFIPAALFRGFFEFSSGIALCGGNGGGVFAAIILGWSGLCVHCQVAAAAGGRFSLKPYFLAKIVQSALMGALAYIFI